MSEENKVNSVSDATPQVSKPVETQEEYVSRKAYEEVTRDMHKFKKEREEFKAARNELEAQLKAQEESKMHEKEQFKELFEKRNAELDLLRKEAETERNRFTNATKRAALNQELGGRVKEEYLNFADLNSVVLTEDGNIDRESVRNVANNFRKEHGQLIPNSESQEITGHAPTGNHQIATPLDSSRMTAADLVKNYAKLKQQN